MLESNLTIIGILQRSMIFQFFLNLLSLTSPMYDLSLSSGPLVLE